jgi:adenosylcobinamide kinase/adenosylcobinamide-phosphate guanylyltransferase
MSLVVLTGPVRSGKSRMAEELAASHGGPVVVAVAGWDGDEEMARRIAAHQASRSADWQTIAVTVDPAWLTDVPAGAVLLLDCLGTLVSHACFDQVGEAEVAPRGSEVAVARAVGALVSALIARDGDTIVVTNETGWGVVPEWPSARVFRDEMGRANRCLVDAAEAAYLVVDGRCVDLKELPTGPAWPARRKDTDD